MSNPTNIPETPMGETKQDSSSKSKEKFQQQLQDIFQTILKLTGPDHFDQLCQWMEYKQYLTIDEFNRNMSKSKGWTLQSSLLMLWMEKTLVNNQTTIDDK